MNVGLSGDGKEEVLPSAVSAELVNPIEGGHAANSLLSYSPDHGNGGPITLTDDVESLLTSSFIADCQIDDGLVEKRDVRMVRPDWFCGRLNVYRVLLTIYVVNHNPPVGSKHSDRNLIESGKLSSFYTWH